VGNLIVTGIAPERRQVLKAGVWTLPAIAVATSAPAYATSSADLRPSTITSTKRTLGPSVTVVLRIENAGAQTSDLRATFTVPSGISATQPATTADGWTLVAGSVNTSTNTLSYKAPAQLGSGQFITPTFVINRTTNGQGSGNPITVDLSPGTSGFGDSETTNITN
jgi:hypothetical protein